MGNLNIIILAGGDSTRFWPLKQKNSYPFLGKTNIDNHIKRLSKIDHLKFFLVMNSTLEIKSDKVTKLIQKGEGMAGAVSTALAEINLGEEVLILNANDYYNEDLVNKFIKIRKELVDKNEALIVGYKTTEYFPGGYLKVNGDYITEIIEKPGEGNTPSNLVNIVFHYFPRASELLKALEKSISDRDDVYEVALDSMMKSGYQFRLLEYRGIWKTIKYSWHVLDVMDYYLNDIKRQTISKNAQISPNTYIKGNVIIEDGVKIFEGAVINGPCYIGRNTIIGNNSLVRNSIIGNDCVVGFGTEVARSYFKNNVWLHKNYIGDSVLESNISFGSGTITGNLRLDEQNIKIDVKGKKIDTNKNKLGTIIGSDVRIGINASIMPGIKIGKNSFIGPGVILNKDVAEDTFVTSENKYSFKKNTFDITRTSREKIKNQLQ